MGLFRFTLYASGGDDSRRDSFRFDFSKFRNGERDRLSFRFGDFLIKNIHVFSCRHIIKPAFYKYLSF